jgi:hypothetical protein
MLCTVQCITHAMNNIQQILDRINPLSHSPTTLPQDTSFSVGLHVTRNTSREETTVHAQTRGQYHNICLYVVHPAVYVNTKVSYHHTRNVSLAAV